ncbi:MAG: hypothetical protein GWO81_01920 [Verrucomicrobia bacterium]|nr:hypothetical protein [Verrucomicrobiota bacterium]
MTKITKFAAALTFAATLVHGAGTLQVQAPGYNFQNADYSSSHAYIDEVLGTTAAIEVRFDLSGFNNITDVEVYTNLNRRDLARIDKNNDNYADGIQPVDGNTITDSAADTDTTTGHYYIPHNMTDANSDNVWELTIPASKTGAYRLTARFKTSDSISDNNNNPNNWIWYGLRDHAVVVSPVDARTLRLYEINVFNIEATGDTFAARSTLEDLHNASGATHNANNRWDLDYLTNLGMNWLWFQPIHPNGIDGREPSDGWGGSGAPYDPGSPYAVKNFFEVNELMTVNYDSNNSTAQTRAAAMTAFQNFVAAADAKEVGIMLDAPFNHTAFDVELGQVGVDLFQPDGQTWAATDEIRNRDARFFSQEGNYSNRASSTSNIAAGPDRFDFGKWNDVKDVFFGRYDSLVEYDAEPERSSYKNEGDWFDTSDSDWTNLDFTRDSKQYNLTRLVWDYFAEYSLHWLTQTGYPEGTAHTEANRYQGIDGLRCDFGQGLPPRAWEYITNVTRERKWNFVMMSESLDGGAVTYRSSRHFDILNENIVFNLNSAANKSDYRTIFEDRRNSYGQALVLLNNTSHDEVIPSDPWGSIIRSAATGLIEGATMIFPGQELGIAGTYGYDHFETNQNKQIPHFKRWNSMTPAWNDSNYGNDQLYPVYSAIQTARLNSPALISANRWFLEGDGGNNQVFATAKYESANTSPASSDVVIGFVNLDRDNTQSDTFKIPSSLATLLGIQDGRTYNVKNIAAYTAQDNTRRDDWLWGSGISGANLKASGFFVSLNKVPTSDSDWATAPYEAQYLKLYDVTPPPGVAAPANSTGKTYVVGTGVTFSWSASTSNTADDNITGYRLVIQRSGTDETVFDQNVGNVTEYQYNGSYGDQLHATVYPVSLAGIEGSASSTSGTVAVLNPANDQDNDGQNNTFEEAAGTDLFDNTSRFHISQYQVSGSNQFSLNWNSIIGKTYGVESKQQLTALIWDAEDNGIAGTGSQITWLDPNPINPVTLINKFYRVTVE